MCCTGHLGPSLTQHPLTSFLSHLSYPLNLASVLCCITHTSIRPQHVLQTLEPPPSVYLHHGPMLCCAMFNPAGRSWLHMLHMSLPWICAHPTPSALLPPLHPLGFPFGTVLCCTAHTATYLNSAATRFQPHFHPHPASLTHDMLWCALCCLQAGVGCLCCSGCYLGLTFTPHLVPVRTRNKAQDHLSRGSVICVLAEYACSTGHACGQFRFSGLLASGGVYCSQRPLYLQRPPGWWPGPV